MPSVDAKQQLVIKMADESWLALTGVRALFTDLVVESPHKREILQVELVRRFEEAAGSGMQNTSAKGFEAELILAMAVLCTPDLGERLRLFVQRELGEPPPAW